MKVIGTPEAFEKAVTCGACSLRVIFELGDLRVVRVSRTDGGRVQAKCKCGQTLDVGSAEELPSAVIKLVKGGEP